MPRPWFPLETGHEVKPIVSLINYILPVFHLGMENISLLSISTENTPHKSLYTIYTKISTTNTKVSTRGKIPLSKTLPKMLQTPQITLANQYDTFNPLYRHRKTTPAEPVKDSKEVKREQKVNREIQMKTAKDTADVIEEKIKEIGTLMLKGLKEGFNDMCNDSKEDCLELIKALKQNMENQKPTTGQETSQRPTKEQEKEQQLEKIKTTNNHPDGNNELETSQIETEKKNDDTEYKSQQDHYQQILQRYSTLPPGQSHLPTSWNTRDEETDTTQRMENQGDPTDTTSTTGEGVISTDQPQINSQRLDDQISNHDLRILFNAISAKMDKQNDEMRRKKLQLNESTIAKMQLKIETLENQNNNKETINPKPTYSNVVKTKTTIKI